MQEIVGPSTIKPRYCRPQKVSTYYAICIEEGCGMKFHETHTREVACKEAVSHATIHSHSVDVYQKDIILLKEQEPVRD